MRNKLNTILPILLIILFPLGQLSVIPLANTTVRIYYHDIIIMILLLINIKQIIQLVHKNTPLIGFTAVSLFSLFLNLGTLTNTQLLISSLYLIRLLSYLVLIILLPKLISLNKARPYIYVAIFTNLIIGFLQYVYFPLLEPMFILGWDRHAYRFVGSHFDPNFTGLILTLGLLWSLNDITTTSKKNIKRLRLASFSVITSLIAILLTYSRSTYLALAAGTPIQLKHHIKPAYFFAITAIIIGFITILPNRVGEGTDLLRTSTINARINNWEHSIELFTQKPLFGHGYNTLRYVNQENSPTSHSASGLDNSILMLLVTVGIMGTFQFFWFLSHLSYNSKNKQLLIASLAAILVHTMFQNSLLYPWILIWIAILNLEK